jgi:pullulanase
MMSIYKAWIDDIHLLTVRYKNILALLQTKQLPIIHWEKKDRYFPVKIKEVIDDHTAKMSFSDFLPIGEDLSLLWDDIKIPIYPRAIVRTRWFDEHYTNVEAPLGAVYDKDATTFTLWAPTATSAMLSLDNKLLCMQRCGYGIWQVKVQGDWHGFPYHYEANINGNTVSANDPYTKAILANSVESVVIDLGSIKQNDLHQERPLVNLADAIIYELHVRDATSHENSGTIHRGKFLGLTELESKTENGYSTALSYIKELGCTHVQLLPINDFARVDELHPHDAYNWGYDPLYFQVPEGSYSTEPDDPLTRISEVKKMINTFHQEGISVIIDVVYNHVFIMEESPFEKLVPGYYFRYHADGTLSNGTGVGNDLATERKMVRKFVLDTIDFWLVEYNIDGFRFDLMGAMDIETMRLIQKRCEKEAIPIMLLGEGWELPTELITEEKATSSNSKHLLNVRFFNDYFRDSLKGDLFDQHNLGYVNGNGHYIERLPHLISGSVLEEYGPPFVDEVNQTINYVECHDNHTLWDRLSLTNPHDDENTRKKMHQLASGITLLSQGVPFIHAGQEWFRSKQGDGNSYLSGDQINQLNWQDREREEKNISFIKKIISIRKQFDIFRLTSKQEIRNRLHILHTPDPVFGFVLLDINYNIAIYINPTNEYFQLHLPSLGEWKVIVTNIIKNEDKQRNHNGEFSAINPYELVVFKKSVRGL